MHYLGEGAFSSALYSTTRLIERSRSRTRERRQAMRSQRSASNYYRLTSQYPAPQRAREYSTPPSREYSRPPSRSGSFISFMEYSGSKNGELSRNASRSSIHDSALALSRSRYTRNFCSKKEKRNKNSVLRYEYNQLSNKLNQAMRQMDLLRFNSYSNIRSSSQPRTSVYTHFYPYY
uniref:Uncharacterized protein n=1 Tax=Angiostrongylus cantonensis TaxID=6313 RepID=A0A0K0D3R9_ANGCA